jgi:NAD(P)-dependent dehydrogenase (short-subunit alcohol dehydrogenase family)
MELAELGPVIVTGGASGLGLAVAQAIDRNGGVAVVFDRDPVTNGFESEVVDLADRRAAEDAVARVAERHGGIGGVVTCAGTDKCGRLEDVPAEDWERVIAVNLLGTVAVVRASLPQLERVHGKVVTVASTLGLKAVSDATAYCASKFGVVGFTRALAAETAGRIGVTLLIPGGMQTHFFDARPDQYKPPPDLELNDPANVAASVVFALTQPPGSEIRELVAAHSTETSWP